METKNLVFAVAHGKSYFFHIKGQTNGYAKTVSPGQTIWLTDTSMSQRGLRANQWSINQPALKVDDLYLGNLVDVDELARKLVDENMSDADVLALGQVQVYGTFETKHNNQTERVSLSFRTVLEDKNEELFLALIVEGQRIRRLPVKAPARFEKYGFNDGVMFYPESMAEVEEAEKRFLPKFTGEIVIGADEKISVYNQNFPVRFDEVSLVKAALASGTGHGPGNHIVKVQ